MIRLVSLSGRATLPDGAPAAGAEVIVTGDGHTLDGFRAVAVCDAEGRFQLDVHPNHYYAFLGTMDLFVSPLAARVVKDQSVDDVEIVLEPATRIHGRLTRGPDRQPQADEYLSLYTHRDDNEYLNLPEDEKFPNPTDSRSSISPRVARSLQTGADGEFEFLAGPGSHYIVGPRGVEAPRIQIVEGEAERPIDLHAEEPESIPVSGRVVLASDPDRGVAEAVVRGLMLGPAGGRLNFVSDAEGNFRGERPLGKVAFFVQTPDKALVGLVRFEQPDEFCVIPLRPTAAARGRLVDEDGAPLAGQTIEYDIPFRYEGGFARYLLGGSVETGPDGSFEISALTPAEEYELYVVTLRRPEGLGNESRRLTTVTAESGETVDLGDVEFASR